MQHQRSCGGEFEINELEKKTEQRLTGSQEKSSPHESPVKNSDIREPAPRSGSQEKSGPAVVVDRTDDEIEEEISRLDDEQPIDLRIMPVDLSIASVDVSIVPLDLSTTR